MISIDKIRSEYGGHICRRCINELYNANLTPDDCVYETMYLRECNCCHQPSHTVEALTRSGRLKTIFK